MSIKDDLAKIVGAGNILDDPAEMGAYSESRSLFVPSRTPNYAVRVRSATEVQRIVELANEKKVPVVPASSGIHLNGLAVAMQGGILVDLSPMQRIRGVDERNRKVQIEAGVTWGRLGPELAKHDFMTMNPLLPHSHSSVLTAWLERQPALNPRFEFGEPISSMEMVWPTGEIFRTGTASSIGYGQKGNFADGGYPYGPGPIDPIRLLQGAQGTVGIVTWANIKTEYLPKVNKAFFIGFDCVSCLADAMYAIQRRRIGNECLALNDLNLATILAWDMESDFPKILDSLPPWALLLVLGGPRWFPEEKIAYEEEALRELQDSVFPASPLSDVIPGYGSTAALPDILRRPWPEHQTYWKWRYLGACEDLFFITKLEKASAFVSAVEEAAAACGFDPAFIGIYIQPIENAAGAHVEFNFYYDPEDAVQVAALEAAYSAAVDAALDLEAHFTRPCNRIVADKAYEKAASYTALLKQTKAIFDPNGILNPGKLCF